MAVYQVTVRNYQGFMIEEPADIAGYEQTKRYAQKRLQARKNEPGPRPWADCIHLGDGTSFNVEFDETFKDSSKSCR